MNNNVKLELEKIYNLFYYNKLKSYLVATGSNEKYKGIKNNNLLIDVEKVITAYGLENIFMGQGINMLVSSFERFLKDIFILLASNYDSIEKEIRDRMMRNCITISNTFPRAVSLFSMICLSLIKFSYSFVIFGFLSALCV